VEGARARESNGKGSHLISIESAHHNTNPLAVNFAVSLEIDVIFILSVSVSVGFFVESLESLLLWCFIGIFEKNKKQ
jgi:hypothetical protein